MRKLITITLSVIIILIGALLIVPFLIPLNTYKKEAETRLSQMTGRDITIQGDVRLKILPDISIGLKDVTVGNPQGFTTPYLAKIASLDLDVKLRPLFNKQVIVQRFVLIKPDVHLEKNADGRPNWNIEFHKPATPTASLSFISEAHATVEAQDKKIAVSNLNLSGFSIENGTLNYTDASSKSAQKLEAIHIKTETVSANKPVNIDGEFKWNDLDFNLVAKLTSLQDIFEQKPTDTSLKLNSEHIKLNFNGKAAPANVDGVVELSTPSIPKLMAWLGKPMEWNKTSLQFATDGHLVCTSSRCMLNKSNIAIDHLRFAGNMELDFSGKPAISGSLDTGVLNLKPFMSRAAKVSFNAGFISNANAETAGRWSTEPIHIPKLDGFNLNLNLSADSLIVPPWQLENNELLATIKDGTATLKILKARIFEGTLAGTISATPSANYVNASCHLNADGINIESLLKQLNNDDRLSGKGNIDLAVQATGATISDMINSLDGSGNIRLRDGAIKGINLAQMARNVKSAFSTQVRGVQKTDFSELSGSFNINNGVISNNDLAMKSPYIRLTGKGNINLPAYTITYRLVPKLVDTSKGQGGGDDKAGIEVPILVTGSLDNPRFAPDMESIVTDVITNPEKMKENIGAIKDVIKENKGEIKEEIKNLKESVKDPKDLLKNPNKLNNLLGGIGKRPTPETTPANPAPSSAPAQAPATVSTPTPAAEPVTPDSNTPAAPAPTPEVKPDPVL